MKQKKQIIALVVLTAVAVLVWGYQRIGHAPSGQTALAMIGKYQGLQEQGSRLRLDEIKRVQQTEYKSNGTDPFSLVARSRPPDADRPKPPVPPPTPPPPPVPAVTTASFPANLKYFGYGTVPVGSPRRAFFTDGEDIFIVPEGETLLGRYRILKVGNTNLEFQEISSGLRGTAPLEEQSVPASAS